MRSQRAWLRKGIANEFSIAICFCRAICRALGVIAVPYSRSFVQAEERSFGRRSTQTSDIATFQYRTDAKTSPCSHLTPRIPGEEGLR